MCLGTYETNYGLMMCKMNQKIKIYNNNEAHIHTATATVTERKQSLTKFVGFIELFRDNESVPYIKTCILLRDFKENTPEKSDEN